MAITVYTYNDKVLKNVATDKWLKKPDVPAGFVMNASNVLSYNYNGNVTFITWQSPTYPNGYNGSGKQFILVNNNASAPGSNNISLVYSMYSDIAAGPNAINGADMQQLGTSTGTLLNNSGGGDFGKWLVCPIAMSLQEAQAYMANFSITILD